MIEFTLEPIESIPEGIWPSESEVILGLRRVVELALIRAFWGPRSFTQVEVGRAVLGMLERFGQIDSSLSVWFAKGRSRAAASRLIALTPEAMVAEIRRRELNFEFSAWSGQDDASSVTVRAGLDYRVAAFPESVVLIELGNHRGDDTSAMAGALVGAVQDLWRPETIEYTTDELMRAQPTGPRAGWVTFADVAPSMVAGLDATRYHVSAMGSGTAVRVGENLTDVSAIDLAAVREALFSSFTPTWV